MNIEPSFASQFTPGGDDTAFVEPAGEVDHDLAGAMVVHHLELPDVSVLHHDGEEPDDDLIYWTELVQPSHYGRTGHLGAGSDENLSLASLLSIVDATQRVGQRVHPHHGGSGYLLSAN